MFIEKLVVKAGVHLMVGKVRQLERQSTKESKRSQLGSAGPEPPKLKWSGYFCTLLPTCALHWQEGVL